MAFGQNYFIIPPPLMDNISPSSSSSCYPPTDILETSEKYIIEAQLPGYKKANINIEVIDSHTVVLNGSSYISNIMFNEVHTEELKDEAKKTEESQAKLTKDLQTNKSQEATSSKKGTPHGSKSMAEKTKEFIETQEKKIEGLVKKKIEVNQEVKKKEQKKYYMLKERHVPESFSRAFSFHTNVNTNGIKATFEDGILMVIVPKMIIDKRIRIIVE